jgi:hypothetical protein
MGQVIINFPDERSAKSFEFWLSCQGEQRFFEWDIIWVTDDRIGSDARKHLGCKPIRRMKYKSGPKIEIEAEF